MMPRNDNNDIKNKNRTFCSCLVKMVGDAGQRYTDFLMATLVPLIYEGILIEPCMKAFEYLERYDEASKENKNVNTPSFDELFQYFLRDFKKMSNTKIDDETRRIRTNSQCAEFFDDLIRAVVKSHITILRCSSRDSETIKGNHHESVDINLFIHKCYIESIKFLFYSPKLFYREIEFQKNGVEDMNFITLQIRTNKEIIFGHIKTGIQNALMQILPMRHIISDYLNTDLDRLNDEYVTEIRDMVANELHKRQPQSNGINLLEEGSDKMFDDYNLDDLIFERKRGEKKTMNKPIYSLQTNLCRFSCLE